MDNIIGVQLSLARAPSSTVSRSLDAIAWQGSEPGDIYWSPSPRFQTFYFGLTFPHTPYILSIRAQSSSSSSISSSSAIMKFVNTVASLAGSATAFSSDIFANSAEAARIPTSYESAVMGRRILALTKLATLSTVFPDATHDAEAAERRPAGLDGVPIGMMDYVADCEEEGNPTILEIKIATTFKNVRAGSNLTLSMNWVPPYPPSKRISFLSRLSAYIPFLGSTPYNTAPEQYSTPDTVPFSAANLPRFSLFGYLEPVKPNPIDAVKLAACFTSKHQDAKYWLPGNVIHESEWARLVVTKVYWVGGFGDRAYIGWIPIEEWKSISRKEWESIKLPGEQKGWNEWAIEETGDL